MDKPFFSIIVPIYNAEECLVRCLDSVQSQSFCDFECLLIDDGSIDNSAVICSRYVRKDSRFSYIHQENGGSSAARNLGLQYSKGIWVCFVDADDYVDDQFLAVFHGLSYRGDLLCQGIIFSSIEEGWKHESALMAQFATKENMAAPLIEMYDRKIYFYLMLKAFHRDIIERNHIRFDVTLRRRQDEMFVNRYISCINSINISSECHYYYYFTTTQRMKSFSSIYERLKFDLDSVTYYSLKRYCQRDSDFKLLTRIAGTRMLGVIFSSFSQASEFRKKKEILFLIKYIVPYKKFIALDGSLRWKLLSPFCTKNYHWMRFWLRLYISTMK